MGSVSFRRWENILTGKLESKVFSRLMDNEQPGGRRSFSVCFRWRRSQTIARNKTKTGANAASKTETMLESNFI